MAKMSPIRGVAVVVAVQETITHCKCSLNIAK